MTISAGFSKVDLMDIMPEQRHTEMPVSARGFYLSGNGKSSFFLVSDFMDFDLQAVTLLKEAMIPVLPENTSIHVLTTHNHGGASWFNLDMERYSRHAVECAKSAVANSRNAKVRIGQGDISEPVSMIRRFFIPETGGSFTCFYGIDSVKEGNASGFRETALKNLKNGSLTFTPEYVFSENGKESFLSADQSVSVMEFRSVEDDRPLGSIVRFAAHAVCCNLPDCYSSDYPGYLREMMESELGGISLFLNGPCAEIAPAIPGKSPESGRMIAKKIATSALQLLQKNEFQPLHNFKDTNWLIPLPVRAELLENAGSSAIVPEQPDDLRERKRILEQDFLHGNFPFLTGIRQNGEQGSPDTHTVSTALLQLNDWNLLFFSGETFYQTAREITSHFPGKKWITVTEHGRTAMYIPPENEYNRGGYEPSCAVVSVQGEKQLREQIISRLHEALL